MEKIIKSIYDQFKNNHFVTTDSRNIIPGSIFFALKGEKFNGNKFAQHAIEKGASLAIIDEEQYCYDDRYVLVNDTLLTLQELAKYHRNNLKARVIGITGSNGKTTTKELILATLSQSFKTKGTEGNFNNHIGVPLTLLSFPLDLEFAVVEMGANHPGEIASLCNIAQPDFGLITNIGKAHLEGFGGFKGVVKTKNELYQFIRKKQKKIFINRDNDILNQLSKDIDTIAYGSDDDYFCSAEITSSSPYVKLEYRVDEQRYQVESQLFGSYNFENIVAAICIGSYFGVPQHLIQEAIRSYQPTNNRSQIINTPFNKIILDAYNANPSSMKVAIQNFLDSEEKNKILILGDMLELGDVSHSEHQEIVNSLDELTARQVYLVGKYFKNINQEKFKSFHTTNELSEFLMENPIKNRTILIKGSRGIQLENLLSQL